MITLSLFLWSWQQVSVLASVCLNSLIDWPASGNAVEDSSFFHFCASLSDGLRKRHFSSLINNPVLVAFIAVLLTFCRPSNIPRFVVSVVVYAIKGMSITRALTNVFMKRLKAFNPLFAHLNAASTIQRVFGVFWVRASLNHACPRHVLRASAQSMRFETRRCDIVVKASTRSRLSLPESPSVRNGDVSAVALAMPARVTVFVALCAALNNKARKALSSQVYEASSEFFHENTVARG